MLFRSFRYFFFGITFFDRRRYGYVNQIFLFFIGRLTAINSFAGVLIKNKEIIFSNVNRNKKVKSKLVSKKLYNYFLIRNRFVINTFLINFIINYNLITGKRLNRSVKVFKLRSGIKGIKNSGFFLRIIKLYY